MIKERMLELLLLEHYKNTIGYTLQDIDVDAYMTRLQELRKEFLSPYVIDSTSKER